jgi:hypothetical protein
MSPANRRSVPVAMGRGVRQRLAGTVVLRDALGHSTAVIAQHADLTASGLVKGRE